MSCEFCELSYELFISSSMYQQSTIQVNAGYNEKKFIEGYNYCKERIDMVGWDTKILLEYIAL